MILAGVDLKEDSLDFNGKMKEDTALCEALGYDVAATISQRSNSMDPSTVFRKGKLEELKNLCQACGAELVVFHNSLSIQAAHRISSIIECDVVDRVSLILDIFASRAMTRQAQLQTELARLSYDLPRMVAQQEESDHAQGGAFRNRGAGEMRSSIIRKRYRERMSSIRNELSRIEKRRMADERRRAKTLWKRVAIVGYANAGKSSLMNAVLHHCKRKDGYVQTKDMLFQTLDTSVRSIEYHSRRFFLYDTVGFVSDLPHTLIDAFQSTLESALDCDLLLECVDISDPDWQAKAVTTADTLSQIGAGDIPIFRVFAKSDLVSEQSLGFHVSSVTGEGIEEMLARIIEMLYPAEEEMLCLVPYGQEGMVEKMRSVLSIETLRYLDEGTLLMIRGERRHMAGFHRYKVKEDEK